MLHSIKVIVLLLCLFLVIPVAGAMETEYEQSLCDELQELVEDPGPCECVTYTTQEGHIAVKIICETGTYAGCKINSF